MPTYKRRSPAPSREAAPDDGRRRVLGLAPRKEAFSDGAKAFVFDSSALGRFVPRSDAAAEDLAQTFGSHVWVYFCVNTIASAISSIPLKVWRGPKLLDIDRDSGDPLFSLLLQPNPWSTWSQLVYAVAASLDIAGNAYILKTRSGPGKFPARIEVILPDRVRIKPDPERKVGGYMISYGGSRARMVPPEDVDHVRRFSATDELYGMSPLQAAFGSVVGDLNALRFQRSFYENAAVPSGVLTHPDDMTEPQVRRLASQWEQRHGGIMNFFRIAVLTGGLRYERIALSQKEIEFIEQRRLSREEIFGVFNVPPILAGLETQNYATAHEQKKTFWQEAVIPRVALIQDGLNAGFVQEFGEDRWVEFDLSRIEALRENQEALAKRHEIYLRMGVMTLNEVRAEMGLPPAEGEGADSLWLPVALQPAATVRRAGGAAGQPPAPEAAPEEPPRDDEGPGD